MNPYVAIAAVGIGLAFVAAKGGSALDLGLDLGLQIDTNIGDETTPSQGGFAEVRRIAQRYVDVAGAPSWFPEMALIQAASESGGNPYVGLGNLSTFPTEYRGIPLQPNRNASDSLRASESRAARTVYERNESKYSQGPYPASRWTWGSGGLFGLLPGSGLAFARRGSGLDALRRGDLDPLDVFDPVRAVGMYANYVKGVMATDAYRSLPADYQDVYAIKRGGAALSLISDYREEKERSQKIRDKMPNRVVRSGANERFLTQRLHPTSSWSSWPGTWEAIQRVEG